MPDRERVGEEGREINSNSSAQKWYIVSDIPTFSKVIFLYKVK